MTAQPQPQSQPQSQAQKPITSFLELPLPFGSQLKQPPVDKDPNAETTVIGFRVKPAERALIQEYINCMRKYPLPNPNGGPPIPWIQEDSIGLLIKNSAISYLMQYNFLMANMMAEAQRQQQQRQQPQPQSQGNVRRQ